MEIAKQATKDTNNDGKTDVWGFSGWAIDAVKHFTAANGAKSLMIPMAKKACPIRKHWKQPNL